MIRTLITCLALSCCALFTTACDKKGEVVAVEAQRVGGDTTATALDVNIEEITLPARHYLVFRQRLDLRDMNGFLAIESDTLMNKARRAGIQPAGPVSSLFYEWETNEGMGDAAVALPVPADTKLPPYVTIEMPQGPALALTFDGPYDRLSAFHYALGQELLNRGYRAELPSIEEYLVGPADTADPARFKTRLIYPFTTTQ